MQHAAVVPGLMPARTLFFLKDEYMLRRESLKKPVCGRQPHDSTADNCDPGHGFRELASKEFL